MFIVERMTIETISFDDFEFIFAAGNILNEKYNTEYNFVRIDLVEFCEKNYLAMCYRNNVPVGFMVASLFKSFFDPDCVVLKQNLLYSQGNYKVAYLLLKDFIDFGKSNANHIITTIGSETNIKPISLEKIGFKKLEENFRMEIK